MTITLKIENCDQLPDGGPLQYQTRQRGFDLGREQHLDWTLPDPSRFISGRHCEIRYEKGGYWLYDVSRNGTFLNGASARMKSPHRLSDGDRLQIGHYLVAVGVEGDAANAASAYDEPAQAYSSPVDSIWDTGQPAPAAADRRDFMPEQKRGRRAPDFSEQYLNFPDMHPAAPLPPPLGDSAPFGESPYATPSPPRDIPGRMDRPSYSESPFGEAPPPAGMPGLSRKAANPPFPASAEGFDLPAPRVRPAPAVLPAQASFPPAPPHAAPLTPGHAASSSAFIQALAEGAGVSPEIFSHRNPDEIAREIGQVLKIVTEQLAMLLKARAAAKVMTKSSDRTMISAADNNPLKFIPASAEVIEVMFARKRAGYLDATRSVEQAFADLKTHEIATFAAMQKALAKLLDGLSPQAVESRLSSSAFASRKARAWDLFVERWDAKTDPYENGMLDVFLSYFSEAYDEAARKK